MADDQIKKLMTHENNVTERVKEVVSSGFNIVSSIQNKKVSLDKELDKQQVRFINDVTEALEAINKQNNEITKVLKEHVLNKKN